MLRTVHAGVETWPLKAPFRISRGERIAAVVVTVTLREGEKCGRGESTPYAHYGESTDSVMAQIMAVEDALADGATRTDLRALLPAGAARNAVDCALWDLEAKLGDPIATSLLNEALPPISTALTVSLDRPERMGEAARALRGMALVKVKLSAEEPEACLRAVRVEVPGSKLIVDANESWSIALLERLQPVLSELDVSFVEQPLPARDDSVLAGFNPLVPICADESCHTTADLERLRGRYGFVNIKLDKTGGLTEALDLLTAARELDFGIMVGCMMCTSLAVAPALHVAGRADFVDLDGPLWLKEDRPGGMTIASDGRISPPRL